MGKVEIGIYVTADVLTEILQKCSLSSPLPTVWILSKPLNLIGCHGNWNAKFAIKILKNLLVRSHRGWSWNFVEVFITLASTLIVFFFYCRCSCAFVAMVTDSFQRLKMGKVKIGLYFYLFADIFTKALQKCPLSNIWILSKLLNLIGCHGNWNAKFAKNYSKIFCTEAIRGIKLKFCRNVHNISLYINCVFYCRFSCVFIAMATYSESRPLFLSHCRYFDKSFSEMFLELSSTKDMNFVQFDWLPWKLKGWIFGKKP